MVTVNSLLNRVTAQTVMRDDDDKMREMMKEMRARGS